MIADRVAFVFALLVSSAAFAGGATTAATTSGGMAAGGGTGDHSQPFTVQDLVLDKPSIEGDKVVLSASFTASTFRQADAPPAKIADPKDATAPATPAGDKPADGKAATPPAKGAAAPAKEKSK